MLLIIKKTTLNGKNKMEISEYFNSVKKNLNRIKKISVRNLANDYKRRKIELFELMAIKVFSKFEYILKEMLKSYANSKVGDNDLLVSVKKLIEKHTIKYSEKKRDFFKNNLFIPGTIKTTINKGVINFSELSRIYKEVRCEAAHGSLSAFNIQDLWVALLNLVKLLNNIDLKLFGIGTGQKTLKFNYEKISYEEYFGNFKF